MNNFEKHKYRIAYNIVKYDKTFYTLPKEERDKILALAKKYQERFKLTRLEYEVLKHLYRLGYGYITRNKYGELYIYFYEPHKLINNWANKDNDYYFHSFGLYNNVFQFIRWENDNPTNIQYILDNCIADEKGDKKWNV